jgi:hypothetical protein
MAAIIKNTNASANAKVYAQEPRELLRITRSEASKLLNVYQLAKEDSVRYDMEHYRVFREKIEELKPEYLGGATSSDLTNPRAGSFLIYCAALFKLIEKLLNREVIRLSSAELNDISSILITCSVPPLTRLMTTVFLDWAVYNWFYRNERNFTEELGDNCIETQTCGICDFSAHSIFYYSTCYGLELPVCEGCLYGDAEDEAKRKEESVYSPEDDEATSSASETETEEEANEEYKDASSETDDDDEEYVYFESDASASETDDDDEDDEDASASETDDETGDEDEDAEFGCSGCRYEFKDGWKCGFKAAMKQMANVATLQRHSPPPPPECEWCGRLYHLKKCGGACGGLVHYCSGECQSKDWREEHKHICAKL